MTVLDDVGVRGDHQIVGANVVGVAGHPVGRIGDDDVGPVEPHEPHQLRHHRWHGSLTEGTRRETTVSCWHPRIRVSEHDDLVHAQRPRGHVEFASPVRGNLLGVVAWLARFGAPDGIAQGTVGTGDQIGAAARRGEAGQRAARLTGFIVGVSMDDHQDRSPMGVVRKSGIAHWRTPQRRTHVSGNDIKWSRLGSNQRPSACEADALPLSYETERLSINDRWTTKINTAGRSSENPNRRAGCDIRETTADFCRDARSGLSLLTLVSGCDLY